MKTKILLSTLFASFLLITNLSAQQPKFEWAKSKWAGPIVKPAFLLQQMPMVMYIITGYFGGTVDFDPGAGTTESYFQWWPGYFYSKIRCQRQFTLGKTNGRKRTDECGNRLPPMPMGMYLQPGVSPEQ